MQDNTELKYIPGQCNIGPDEINKRLRLGYIGLGTMILFIIAFEVFQFPDNFKLLLFIPCAYTLSGFLQARQRFCFLYGFFGLFSLTGKRQKILEASQLHRDRNKALIIILQVLLGSGLATLFYLFFSWNTLLKANPLRYVYLSISENHATLFS